MDEKMMDTGREPARTMTPEEEEALLNYSEEEGTGTQAGDGDDEEMPDDDSDEARQRREKEAEESDRLAKLAEIQERIRRRKAEKERRIMEQKKKEDELRQAEQERIRTDVDQSRVSFLVEEERRIHQAQIRRLEEELRRAKESVGHGDEEEHGDEEGDEHGGEHSQKRGRSHSQDSKNESSVSGTLGANLLNLPAGYRAVRSSKLNSLAVRHLNGGSAIPFQPIGSFAHDRDARVKYANKISDSLASRNISSSFNLANFVCNTCTTRGEHVVLGKNSDGNDGTGQIPPCFVLSDQNFPAVIPVEGDGDCFKILQVENASLSDLTTVFLAALEGFAVPAGAVVLISSVSHLAAVGAAAYAEDLVRAYRAVRAVYGNGITVMHGIPFLLSGLHSHSTIRALLEIEAWYSSMTAHSTKEISSSRAIFASTLRIQKKDSAPSEHEHGTPVNRAPERFLLKMPQNLHSYDKQVYLSEGFGDQESLCQPIDEGCEQVLISSMIDELNNKCGLELSHEYNLYRPSITSEPDREDVTEGDLEKVVLVGGSHSTRLADELDETCLEVMDLSVRGWRLSEASVEEKAKELTEVVSNMDPGKTTIVYQLYDNSSYLVKRNDGSRVLPEKGQDGKYHVDGRLEVATREEAKRMVSTSIPLLRAGGQCRKVILTPSGRYKYFPCCNVRGHCCNMKERNYGRWMEEKMSELKGIVRDYVRMRNIKRSTVMEFGKLITPSPGQSEYLQEEEIWGEDPVHYTQKGYSLAAAGLESLVYEKKAEEREEESKPNPPKKPRLDLTKNRPAWCMGSVAEAVRSDGPASSSNWAVRGRAAPRGGRPSDRSGGRGRGGYGNGRGRGSNEPYRGRSEAPRGHWVPRGGRPHRGRGRGRPF
jgi:hypothetical protein